MTSLVFCVHIFSEIIVNKGEGKYVRNRSVFPEVGFDIIYALGNTEKFVVGKGYRFLLHISIAESFLTKLFTDYFCLKYKE